MNCQGCACDHCLYNAELESWYFTPGEIQDVEDVCYCCDECRHYDGDRNKRSQRREECGKRKLPRRYIEEHQRRAKERAERAAETRRKNFVVIRGGT